MAAFSFHSALLAALVLLGGCAGFQMGEQYDPNAVYLNGSRLGVTLTRQQLNSGRYKCWDATLWCESRGGTGIEFDCRCVARF